MTKIDLKKELKHLYQPSAKEVVIVDVPHLNFLMITGKGDPNTSTEFQQAMEALYGVAYTLKFDLKNKGVTPDFTVMPLEGLWWTEGQAELDIEDKDNWLWTMMILQPEHVTLEHVNSAAEQLKRKKDPPLLERVTFESYHEGRAAQIMYIGPYADEGPTIKKIQEFIERKGFRPHNKHHEIYLSDPRRTKPEKLKTIIRLPFC